MITNQLLLLYVYLYKIYSLVSPSLKFKTIFKKIIKYLNFYFNRFKYFLIFMFPKFKSLISNINLG